MKVSKETPDWAIKLINDICAEYNRGKPGEIKWSKLTHTQSSHGSCRYSKTRDGSQRIEWKVLKSGRSKRVPFHGRLTIYEGFSQFDSKLVLLHELAHWTAYRTRSAGHTAYFWKRAFQLYQDYGLDMERAYGREKHYKKKATDVYERHFKVQ